MCIRDSRYIIQNKAGYYEILQKTRTDNDWESMVLYILKGVEVTAKQNIDLVVNIKKLMATYKNKIRQELPKIYSQDLLNNLFKNPVSYTHLRAHETVLDL